MVKPTLRTKTVGAKVSDDEYAQLEAAAAARGKTLGEWAREALLDATGGGPSTDAMVLAELLALRTIVLNVLYKLANGEAISAEQMRQLIERADAGKVERASERLRGEREGG